MQKYSYFCGKSTILSINFAHKISMLTHLFIKNYALIEQLELYPHQNFNVITGETGAGKSIMLGAVGLLLGNRSDRKALFDDTQKCVVEATFDISAYKMQRAFEENELDYEVQTVIRREIAASGKSRAFINDTPVTLDILANISTQLVDIHSQHDNLLLGDNIFQLKIIDGYAAHPEMLSGYFKAFSDYKKVQTNYKKLLKENETYKKELDYNSFLLEELVNASLKIGEQETLEKELNTLENAEELKTKFDSLVNKLVNNDFSIVGALKQASNELSKIASLSDKYDTLYERLENARIEVKDVAEELESEFEELEFDPEKIEEKQERLEEIFRLQRKHKVETVSQLIDIQNEINKKVELVLTFDEEIEKTRKNLQNIEKELQEIAQKISDNRKLQFQNIEKALASLLSELGMPNAILKITQEITEPTAYGIDKINFLFSANKGMPPQEIKNVASGGEFSRLMLAIKYILAGKTALPTLIFDEVDTGISGEVGSKMGNMMLEMAQKHQIITITHLHQIAARGNNHYFVYKKDTATRTISNIKQLTENERITEIAKMISGAEPSQTALASARELLLGS